MYFQQTKQIFKMEKMFEIIDEKTNLASALGLTEGFDDLVIKTMKKEAIDCETWTQVFENTLNKIRPNNAIEGFYIGWVAAKLYDQQQAGPESILEKVLRGMI